MNKQNTEHQEKNYPNLKMEIKLNSFVKDETQMAKKHFLNCSTCLANRGMQIKTTLTFRITQVRMAKNNKTNGRICRQGFRERGAVIHCW